MLGSAQPPSVTLASQAWCDLVAAQSLCHHELLRNRKPHPTQPSRTSPTRLGGKQNKCLRSCLRQRAMDLCCSPPTALARGEQVTSWDQRRTAPRHSFHPECTGQSGEGRRAYRHSTSSNRGPARRGGAERVDTSNPVQSVSTPMSPCGWREPPPRARTARPSRERRAPSHHARGMAKGRAVAPWMIGVPRRIPDQRSVQSAIHRVRIRAACQS